MAIDVIDFFSGCGGTSTGFKLSGLNILAGLDVDKDAGQSYKLNHKGSNFILGDLTNIKVEILNDIVPSSRARPLLFSGCAPCQPFSSQYKKNYKSDPRSSLIFHFLRFIKYWEPELIFIENVPGIQKIDKDGPFQKFCESLAKLNYQVSYDIYPALSFNVPQTRNRLVMIASKIGNIKLPDKKIKNNNRKTRTVRDYIYGLPKIEAGETCPTDPQHQAAKLSDLNLMRIKNTPEGGSRKDWPEALQLKCHQSYSGHSDVYGRLAWDKPASALTTRCISYSNGRFGHPEQNRALSVRESALLQTFPADYSFCGSLGSRAKQIGNAVPPLMAKSFGENFLDYI